MSHFIRIGGNAHLAIVARRTARRLEALQSRRFAAAFTGRPLPGDAAAMHRELLVFGPMGCTVKLISCNEFIRHRERFVPDAFSTLFSDMLRNRFEGRIRSACGITEGQRIYEQFTSEAFCEPVPLPGDSIWVARAAVHAIAYYRFVEMRGGTGYPMSNRIARLALLSGRMIPLGTLRNEPREWVVLCTSTVDVPRFHP